jgi:cell division protein FtsL
MKVLFRNGYLQKPVAKFSKIEKVQLFLAISFLVLLVSAGVIGLLTLALL